MRSAGTAISLRTRLLRTVGWPLLAVLLLSSFYDYYSALDRATDSQDLALERIAIALASRLDLDADDADDAGDTAELAAHLARIVAAMQRANAGNGKDQLRYLVVGNDGTVTAGDPQLRDWAAVNRTLDAAVFHDHTDGGAGYRVATFPHLSTLGPVTVVVAETTHRRDAQAQVVLIDTVLPDLALVVLAVALVYLGVRWGVRPLDRLRAAVAARESDDLSPLPQQPLPAELKPLAGAINALMAHLRASAESQQAFLSTAAHQLRTPLAGMQTQLELARRDTEGPQRQRLDALHEAMLRMGRSTSQMLALARAGPQAVGVDDFETVDLQGLLEEAATTWLDFALSREVDLGFEARPALLRGSPWMLRELLGNLIHNAIRHSPAQGRVTVRSGTDSSGASLLEVEDEGPGIPEAERARVFERFYQAPGAARGGSGLGLAVVREVALRHGASVALADARGDAGSPGLRVLVTFPPTSLSDI